MMEVVVTTGALRHAKLQWNRHHQQTNIHLFKGQMSFLSPNQQCQSIEGNTLNNSLWYLNVVFVVSVFVKRPIIPAITPG